MIIFEVGGVAEKTAVKPCWRMQGCGEKRPLSTVRKGEMVGGKRPLITVWERKVVGRKRPFSIIQSVVGRPSSVVRNGRFSLTHQIANSCIMMILV
ncbi:MAG: hypothetical protein R3C62_19570 [Chloroflexota bacterium]